MGPSRRGYEALCSIAVAAIASSVIQTLLTSYLIGDSLHTNAGRFGPAARKAEYKNARRTRRASTMHCNRGDASASIAAPPLAPSSAVPQSNSLSHR